MDKLGFLKRLLELWKEYGEVAKDLLPIIKKLAGELQYSGLTTEQIVADTKADKVELDALLAQDLGSE